MGLPWPFQCVAGNLPDPDSSGIRFGKDKPTCLTLTVNVIQELGLEITIPRHWQDQLSCVVVLIVCRDVSVADMSNQPPQRVRRNGSPSTAKQGPMKAVKAFSLRQSGNSSSPVPKDSHKLWSGRSSDNKHSPDNPTGSHSQSQSPNLNHKGKYNCWIFLGCFVI